MPETYTIFSGKRFIEELISRDHMNDDEAKAWIKLKTGKDCDPVAMYKLRWPSHENSEMWSGYENLNIRIMRENELDE